MSFSSGKYWEKVLLCFDKRYLIFLLFYGSNIRPSRPLYGPFWSRWASWKLYSVAWRADQEASRGERLPLVSSLVDWKLWRTFNTSFHSLAQDSLCRLTVWNSSNRGGWWRKKITISAVPFRLYSLSMDGLAMLHSKHQCNQRKMMIRITVDIEYDIYCCLRFFMYILACLLKYDIRLICN
jgi:hypothetical protein